MLEINSRQEFADIMFRILNPLKKYYSPEKAWLKVGHTSAHYPDSAAHMEGFSRPLWGLGSYWAGGGVDVEWEGIYLKGLAAGSDPDSAEYWGDCVPFDQKLVEMAAIAFNLLWVPEKIWEPLSDKEKRNLVNWLSQINTNPCHSCNWRFFHILVNVALKKLGMEYDAEGMEDSLKFIEDCYVGDGWYLDGVDGPADYYVPFGMHFYGIVYSMFMKEDDPERCQRFVDRAMEFGKDFAYWFASDGSGLPYGRSLTYRFAQVSFYSACVMAGLEPIPLGEMKGIIVRHLEYWLDKPIFDNDGVLTIGYAYPNLTMAETYNAPGSPYWSMKTFTCLTLPADAPFWSVKALPLPDMEGIKEFPKAKMIMQRTDDGHTVAFPAGLQIGHVHAHMEEKYSKFAYSTKYGFSVLHAPCNFWEAAPDSVLAFEIDGHIFIRRTIKSYKLENGKMISEWSPFMGISVCSQIIPNATGHKRIHTIESGYDCIAYDSGFAMPIGDESCKVRRVQGDGEEMIIRADPNTNLLHSKTDIPTVKYVIKRGINVIETEVLYNI